ncbi:MAG: RNA polymerase sigma factor [Mangrovibacterium sp.]
MTNLKLHSETELIGRLQQGDQFAFEVLFYKYKNKLKGFVAKLAPPQVDPEEIVQKVFIKIWLQKEKLDPEKSFSSFLYTIAKNELIDQLRSSINKKTYLMGDELLADLNVSDPAGVSFQEEMEQTVTMLIGKLPERRRKIFELSRYQGFSYKQIASELGISENTVDTQIRLALNFIRLEVSKVRSILLFFISR